MKLHIAVVTVASALLSGCASLFSVGDSEYGCSGLPEGVRCMSARDVYAATEYADQIGPTDAIAIAVNSDPKLSPRHSAVVNSGSQPSNRVPVMETERELPIRTPARVMRVWIAPWEDSSGILHASEYLFKEIEGRRWSIGNRAAVQNNLTPLGSDSVNRSSSPLGGK